jgi:hypothetical protein
MSAIEQGPNGPSLDAPRREPPPVVFATAAAKAARPVVPKIATEREPLSRAAARRRTSWARRVLALIIIVAAVAGIATAIKDSKITIRSHKPAVAHSSTLLSAQQLGLTHARRHRRHH